MSGCLDVWKKRDVWMFIARQDYFEMEDGRDKRSKGNRTSRTRSRNRLAHLQLLYVQDSRYRYLDDQAERRRSFRLSVGSAVECCGVLWSAVKAMQEFLFYTASISRRNTQKDESTSLRVFRSFISERRWAGTGLTTRCRAFS
jgi:hypothetical protein